MAISMGILNIQKTKMQIAKASMEDIVNIYPVYTAQNKIVEANDFKEEIVEEKIEEVEEENIIVAKAEPVASRGSYVRETEGVPADYVDVLEVKATAYCLCKKCCGKSPDNPAYGYTASGLRIVPGTGMKVIAVDPSVVKLGTDVYVEGLNGAVSYGYAIAADTGSAIKNKKIDLYMDTHEEALRWGIRDVKLYILP